MTFPTTTSTILGTRSLTPGSTIHSEDTFLEVEEGVKETYILSGFREDDPDDCTLADRDSGYNGASTL
jgi:hypothetical protein